LTILALDTSTATAGAAVMQDGTLLAESFLNNGLTHSHHIMSLCEQVVTGAGLRPCEIDVLGVAVGPGSFTGLRIGVSTVKALAKAMQAKVAAVDTLWALALQASVRPGLVVPILNARREQVYGAVYRAGRDDLECLVPSRPMMLKELLQQLPQWEGEPFFLGDGVTAYASLLGQCYPLYCMADDTQRYLRAASVAKAAQQLADQDRLIPGLQLEPNYLRLSQAERERLAREGETK